ncbi:MAG TPA: toast rack family protein [Candidatus Acidoferrales bacterium]|nr:toast rack family protein [Candidatus Acidoferrales bacterium]
MVNEPRRRPGSLFWAFLLIGLGAIFLYANLRPEWSPWPLISRYWPVLLIVYGLGRLWDALRSPSASAPGSRPARRHGGEIFAIFLVIVLLVFAAAGSRRYSRIAHSTETVDAQGAQSVRMDIEMPSGELTISGGAAKLLEGDFHYAESDGQPVISYNPSGTDGNLSLSQPGHSGFNHLVGSNGHSNWTIRLNDDLTRELRVEMGAGQGNLNLSGVHLTKLTFEVGAGELNADLTGDWQQDVDVRVEGGVGSATIRLPRSVGVRVHADGAIGSIDVSGLRRQGDYYVNEAYGNSRVTMNVRADGGIGEIRLIEQP